jgi:GrpB-like predicted nucleotidyltransferase (UPF0157 family)
MDEIIVGPYDPAWPAKFELEREFVAGCFAVPPLLIEHMGSTAVPGLPAKPVIDLIVLVNDLADGLAAVPALEAGGYSYWRDNPDKTKLFLVKGLPPAPHRTHHLHIHSNRAEIDRHLAFRDALRRDPALRDRYSALKLALARQFRHDRDAYSDAKTAFVDEVVSRTGGPRRSHPRVARN